MVWLTLTFGLIFATLLAGICLHTPTRVFAGRMIRLCLIRYPWLGWALMLTPLPLLIARENYIWAALWLILCMLYICTKDAVITHRQRRQLAFTLQIADWLAAYINGGLDMMSAWGKLTKHNQPEIAELSNAMHYLCKLGIVSADMVLSRPRWKSNPTLVQLMRALCGMAKTGAALNAWLGRYREYLQKKIDFRERLHIRTTQVKLQFYTVTAASWLFCVVTVWAVPGAAAGILVTPTCQLLIVMGLASQAAGLAIMKHVLRGVIIP